MATWYGTVALLLSLVACSDGEGSSESASGSSGSGGSSAPVAGAGASAGSAGAGGAGGGASGAGSVVAVRAAFSFHITPGEGCPLSDHYFDLPAVDGGHPVTATGKAMTVVDPSPTTNFGTNVTCTWNAPMVPSFSAGLSYHHDDGTQSFLSMQGRTVVGEAREGGITMRAADWPEQIGGQCVFTQIEVDEVARSVWGHVTCAELEPVEPDPSVPNICTLVEGYYLWENCTPREY